MPSPNERFDRAEGTMPYKPQTRRLNPLDVMIVPGWNVRDVTSIESKEHIAALKLAILTDGYDETKPISVHYDRARGLSTLVDGQCRLTACRQIRNDGQEIWIPAVVTEGDEAQMTANMLSSSAQQNLSQWEIGEGCRRLLRFGWPSEKIAASICKPLRYVTDAIALSNVSLEAKSMMAAHQVTPARVLQEVKEHGDNAVEALKEAVKEAATEPELAGDAPAPARTVKPKPLARKKAPSGKEEEMKAILKAIRLLLADVKPEELEEPSYEFISVDRVKLSTLAEFVKI